MEASSDGDRPSDVSILGTGAMGSAIARLLLGAGKRVTVWNRTAARARALVDEGARLAPSPAAAIAASPVTIVVLLDYAAVRTVLSEDALASCAGRTLVEMTTGKIGDVEEIAARARAAGISFLDGGIMAYPRDMGMAEAVILYSGEPAAFREHEQLLLLLAGAQRFVGSTPGKAKHLYSALSIAFFAALSGFFEAGALAASADTSLSEFAELFDAAVVPMLRSGAEDAARRIESRSLEGDQATIDVHVEGFVPLLSMLREAGVGSRSFEACDEYVKEAQSRGMGSLDVAAAYEIIRRA